MQLSSRAAKRRKLKALSVVLPVEHVPEECVFSVPKAPAAAFAGVKRRIWDDDAAAQGQVDVDAPRAKRAVL